MMKTTPSLPTAPDAPDPLIVRWIAQLEAHPEATPAHRRFAGWVRQVWQVYQRKPALWRGLVELRVAHGNVTKTRVYDDEEA